MDPIHIQRIDNILLFCDTFVAETRCNSSSICLFLRRYILLSYWPIPVAHLGSFYKGLALLGKSASLSAVFQQSSMAIFKSCHRPIVRPMRPMRAVRASKYDPLNRWLAVADMKTAPELYMRSPLADDQAMCEVYVSVIEVYSLSLCCNCCLTTSQGFRGTTYRLSVAAYHPLVEHTNDIHLDHFHGSPDDADAPLWVHRLPPHKLLRFPQPLDFVGKLVGGITDIPVRPFYVVSLQ